jgi:histidinol dehydrogenase
MIQTEAMKVFLNPDKNDWPDLAKRPEIAAADLETVVKEIFDTVKKIGDEALLQFTEKFDKVKLNSVAVSTESVKEISSDLQNAILLAKSNIEKFHASQREEIKKVETTSGVTCWREIRAIERVGVYIPGGSAPLFSTILMLVIPAKLAGCKEIVLCTPPDKNGKINPVILYTAKLLGLEKIYAVGGIQAIAAMTFGTETITKVDKVFGPGNQYVTAAKKAAQNYGVAIDMPAGPSEVLIIADENCVPEFVAADLLSQAEHGGDSQVILLSDNETVIQETIAQLKVQLEKLPRKETAALALENSKAILLKDIDSCIEFSNIYAPEHLILAIENAENIIPEIMNAGSVFLGNYSCESAGDYASGTNHTLPTNGYARNYSGVSLDSFLKKITFQKLTENGLKNIGPAIELMADAENLFAHKNAVTVRLKKLNHV